MSGDGIETLLILPVRYYNMVMKKFFLSLVSKVLNILPDNAPEYIYSTILKPRPLRAMTNKLVTQLIKSEVEIAEGVIVLNQNDPVVSGALSFGVYEIAETKFFRKRIKPGMTVLDVGANIGYFSIIFGALVGNSGKVISFEPSDENFSYLEKSIKRNEARNITPVKSALSDSDGESVLFISPDNKGDHRTYDSGDSRPTTRIQTITLDSYCARNSITRIDFMKIDVQGGEAAIFLGMENILKTNTKLKILMEFWPYGLRLAGEDPLELLHTIQRHGFVINKLIGNSGDTELVKNIDDILLSCKGAAYVNLYLSRTA